MSETLPQLPPGWDQRYREMPVEQMPWFFPMLDPDMGAALEARGIHAGRVLDLGTGPGTQAIALAQRGFQVTGADLSPAAVEGAARRAERDGVHVDFVVNDILNNALEGPFDVVWDRGCFHTFDPDRRPDYERVVAGLLPTGGWLILKCFSHRQPGTMGPRRVHPDEIRATFDADFEVLSIVETEFQGQHEGPAPLALICTLRRR